jgi:hypothetical protein
VRGIASLLRRTPRARFACSSALRREEFFTLTQLAGELPGGGSGVDELAAVLDHLRERDELAVPYPLTVPQWASERRELLAPAAHGRPFAVRIWSLAPSDLTLTAAYQEISALVAQAGQGRLRLPNISPNHASVVLWVEAADKRVLLGGDLEHVAAEGRGWRGVMTAHTDPIPASVFKVPHHGGQSADCPQVWQTMLAADPVAVIAPFNGGKWIPSASDVARIVGRTTRAYCTARHAPALPRRAPLVEKKIRQYVRQRRAVVGPPGHIRVRWRVAQPGAVPTIAVYDGAHLLT